MEKKISIAMATYNGSKYLKEQIESIINQTYPPFEIIICDDQSSDDTSDLIKENFNHFPIKFFSNKNKLGVIKNFQKAVSLCSGDYIALSDQDDVWYPNKLKDSLDKMLEIENPNYPCLVFSDLEFVDESLQTLNFSFWNHLNIDIDNETFNKILFRNSVTGSTILMNRNFKDDYMYFPDETIMHDHWMALIAFSFGKFAFLNQPTVKYRQHTNNVTQNFKIPFWSRIKSNVVRKSKRELFLRKELAQANAFYRIFGSKLNDHLKEELSHFINLEKRNYFVKKLIFHLTLRSGTNH